MIAIFIPNNLQRQNINNFVKSYYVIHFSQKLYVIQYSSYNYIDSIIQTHE